MKNRKQFISLVTFVILVLSFSFAGAQQITYEGTAIGCGASYSAQPDFDRSKYGLTVRHVVHFEIEPTSVTPVSAAKIMLQGSPTGNTTITTTDDGAVSTANVVIGSDATRFGNDAFTYRLSANNYTAVASATGHTFSDTYLVSASLYGVINTYINSAGTVTTDAPIVTMEYASASAAITAAEAMVTPATLIRFGMIVIQNNGTLWTANTDDLTDASDVTLAAFYSITSSFTEIAEYTLTATDIALGKGTFYVDDSTPARYVRIFLSEMTGAGNFAINDTVQITGSYYRSYQ